jgi:peptidyl-prolyl cis-trans isomerase C
MGVAIACAGCAKKPSGDGKILARVSNKFITMKEFKARIAKMPPYYRNIVEKNEKRYLDDMIVEMLFYEEAVRSGLTKDKEVQDVINEARKKILIAKFIKTEVEDKIKVTDEEMRQFYEANKDKFKSPPLWRASHILVGTEQQARDILAELSKGANFEDLARAHSMDATATRGGDVGYFRLGQVVPDFEKACLKLNVGELSDVVHTQFGYHVIKLTDKKEPMIESYDRVKAAIESELKKGKRSELFDKLVLKLRGKYGVEIKEDAVKSLNELDKESEPAAKSK